MIKEIYLHEDGLKVDLVFMDKSRIAIDITAL